MRLGICTGRGRCARGTSRRSVTSLEHPDVAKRFGQRHVQVILRRMAVYAGLQTRLVEMLDRSRRADRSLGARIQRLNPRAERAVSCGEVIDGVAIWRPVGIH